MVSDEEVEPPEDSFPNPQDTITDVLSDPPCIDSARTEHSEPQAKRGGGAGDAVGVDGGAEEGEVAGREDRLEPAGNNTVIYIYI